MKPSLLGVTEKRSSLFQYGALTARGATTIARTPSADSLATKQLTSALGRKRVHHFSMVRAAVRAERDGPIRNNEGVFSFGFGVSGEETGSEFIVGGGEGVNGDVPATVCQERVDAWTQIGVRHGGRSGDINGRVA
jgi:hypothetical protein